MCAYVLRVRTANISLLEHKSAEKEELTNHKSIRGLQLSFSLLFLTVSSPYIFKRKEKAFIGAAVRRIARALA